MTYRGRLRLKGVPFFRFQVYERVVISLVKVSQVHMRFFIMQAEHLLSTVIITLEQKFFSVFTND